MSVTVVSSQYAMLPLIQEAVVKNNWLPLGQIVDFIAVSESTPGPFAINIATYVGMKMGGVLGAICATLGVVLPSFIIILIVAGFFEKFKSSSKVESIMSGLKPAVIGLIGSAVISIGKTALPIENFKTVGFLSFPFISSLIIFGVSAFLVFKKKTHPIIVIVVSAVLGIVSGYLPAMF